ncbi:hypothetical protein [Acidiferrobacter sp.]|jgi:hypothetical protein|uniref:hypothetical protein n=1 Tax=Acidiferrobacter sp. TaxID=1872107 RepID=UPI0026072654|nr:hypothetical protein [Acidiferrobacter sp.]
MAAFLARGVFRRFRQANRRNCDEAGPDRHVFVIVGCEISRTTLRFMRQGEYET